MFDLPDYLDELKEDEELPNGPHKVRIISVREETPPEFAEADWKPAWVAIGVVSDAHPECRPATLFLREGGDSEISARLNGLNRKHFKQQLGVTVVSEALIGHSLQVTISRYTSKNTGEVRMNVRVNKAS